MDLTDPIFEQEINLIIIIQPKGLDAQTAKCTHIIIIIIAYKVFSKLVSYVHCIYSSDVLSKVWSSDLEACLDFILFEMKMQTLFV